MRQRKQHPIVTGLDRLLGHAEKLAGRRWALLSHGAAVTRDLRPAHLALSSSAAGRPVALFGPEHGYYGVEQDMVASADEIDTWTGVPVLSLYGDDAESLRPRPGAFDGLDLLVIDLQDVGCRYYTYAATAVWSAEIAIAQGVEVWLLDRPNPLGGSLVEGNLRQRGFESFVGAFAMPVRHGLTLGEILRLEGKRRGWDEAGLRVWTLGGWQRSFTWDDLDRPWIAPSPNMPTPEIAALYPGSCLVEATTMSEGRGTTRPFQLVGAPGIDPKRWADALETRRLPGATILPTYFKPQFQKHAGEACGGIEIRVTDEQTLRPYRLGIEILRSALELFPEAFDWRPEPYEFIADIPAIDLLTGSDDFRRTVELGTAGADEMAGWLRSWRDDETAFRTERNAILLYA
ncbi:MAG: DUF1343 domain-containing protein [Thermoanaerobaculia bacterium]|nr:DUF1343 domain-containing protein [Thermoanaerobaculia bacterium]